MRTELKNISFEWNEETKKLRIEVADGDYYNAILIPFRNLYSLRVFIARIYRKYLNAGIIAKRKKK